MNRLLIAIAAIGIGLAVPHAALANRPACGNTPAAPILASSPVFPESELVIEEGLTGTANVLVDLDDNGVVRHASVLASAGNAILDNEALRVAKGMHFVPQGTCPAIAGSYSVLVEFKD